MKTRSLGIIFVAAVIVPSILLAVLSIRSAGREEAWAEKELETTLLAEVTHVAGLAAAETAKVAEELREGLEVPAGSGAERVLGAWKRGSSLVAVPFLLSPRSGVVVPRIQGQLSAEERRFLEDNGEFLSNRAPTAVFENIAVRYQDQVLAEAEAKKIAASVDKAAASLPPAVVPQASLEDESLRSAGEGASADQEAGAAPAGLAQAAAAPAERAPAAAPSSLAAESRARDTKDSASLIARREAIDTFAQSEEIQSKLYEQAKEKGDILNTRVVAPLAKASKAEQAPLPEPDQPSVPAQATKTLSTPLPAQGQQSQFVVTSQLLGQIASQGEYGIIPRFIGSRLTFLFWEKQADGRIAGCGIAEAPFRQRLAATLPPTYTSARLLTILDESGTPLAEPPGFEGLSWRRPFVAREIGESLPRWEAAAILTDPGAVTARARRASVMIWVLALILFVSVAGGGTMVLSAVYSEVRLARKKSTFVTNVSHELKTPLTSISLFVEMLRQKRQPDPAKQQQYLALVASETERLTRLINNVLDFSSIEKGRKQYALRPMDLAEVAREIVESQRVRLESRGFVVSFQAPAGGNRRGAGGPRGAETGHPQPPVERREVLRHREERGGRGGAGGGRRVRARAGQGDRRGREGPGADLPRVHQGGRLAHHARAGHGAGPHHRAQDRACPRRGRVAQSPRGGRERLRSPPARTVGAGCGGDGMKQRILVAEDDPAILTAVSDLLEGEGFSVAAARDGAEALSRYAEAKPDLLLLDIMMPEKSGFEVCREIRRTDSRTPIIMLTAKGEEVDKVVGLELGADDYVVKPFGVNELLARVRACLRRRDSGARDSGGARGARDETPIEFGSVRVDPRTLTGLRGKAGFAVTPREMKLLRLFASHEGEALDRSFILEEVWGVRYEGTTRTLDQHVAGLRKKIEIDPAQPRHITTVHGVGYRFSS